MAQHYPIDLDKEIEIKKSIQRIGKYIIKCPWLLKKKNFEEEIIYGKNIMFLSDEYKENEDEDFFVVTISPYDLKRTKEEWGEFWKQANLECHFDRQGNIYKIYYPL